MVGSLGLLILASCKKNDAVVTTNGGTPGKLSASSTNLVLDKTKVNDTSTAITFSFGAPQYGFKAAVTSTLQIDVPSDNWKNPISATLASKVYSQSYNTATFNNMLLKLNLAAGASSTVDVRVEYALSSTEISYSNVLPVTVTPFNLTSWVYVPGAYEGWSNPGPQMDSLVSVTGNGIYTGIINFTAGNNQFLVIPVYGSWNNKWATSAPATNPTGTSVNDPVVYNGANNFYAPVTAGYYLVTLNTVANTMSIVPADSYSLIGSAAPGTAWTTDTQMKFINDGNNTWVLNNVPMTVGEYKFRLDDAWNISWGPGATAGTAVTSGAVGDGNMQLTTAGNYNLTLVQPPTALGGAVAPLATTTYTAVKQ
jgi:hypothetical protein